MKKRNIWYLLQAFVGIILFVVGEFGLTSENASMASGLCIGVGAAITVLDIGWFIQSLIVPAMETEKIKRIKNIEVNDERNTRIREKTGYMVAKIMNYLLLLFILTLGFMGVDKLIIVIAVFLVIIELILVIHFSYYYSKKM